MLFEALQARYGDCLFITLPGNGPGRPIRLLIDGGPSGVFRTALKKRLDDEAKAFPAEKPLAIDAVMISHIDEDHILGVLDMFAAIQDADQRHAPRTWQPKWLLHNSFDAILGDGEGGVARSLGTGNTVLAGLGGEMGLPEGGELSHTAKLVLQSYGQGSKLASLSAALKIARNPPDQQPLSFVTAKPRVLQMGAATLTIVGPLQKEIDKLRKEWAKWKASQKDPKATQSLAAYVDESVPNLSSIVVMLQSEGHSALLTGDARADYVMTGLEEAGYLPVGGKMHVDILKLPHHGSARNIDLPFLDRVHADHYVASGDGTYGNPDRETLEMIEKARPDGGYTVHLTYPAADCDTTHQAWAKDRKSAKYTPAKNSIAQVVARWRDEGKIKVVEGPVKIEL
ncbi:MAG: hypothetical protein EOP62_14485 [Sphingomonadales bacterium]|nr:MAG: hypothetical protein EOP62_14485 [Sphingomonadales bacterium]